MSETPSDPQTAVPTDDRRRRLLGPLPVWAWVLLTIVLVIALIAVGIALFSGDGGKDAGASASPTATSASPTPSAAPTVTATPTATAGSDLGQGTFDSGMDYYLGSVLWLQDTAVFSGSGTFSDPIFVLVANSGVGRNMTPDEAAVAMEVMFAPYVPGVDNEHWDLALPETTLEGYRAGPYGLYFPVGAIVARSPDGHVFSFIGDGEIITTMFMAASEDLLH